MNSKVKGIIAGSVAVVLLGSAVVVLQKTGNPNTDSSSSSADTSVEHDHEHEDEVLILENTAQRITSVKIENSFGKFTVEKPASGKSSWHIKDLAKVNEDSDLENSLIETVGQMTAYKLVEENCEDFSKYGLDKPTASFTVTYDDKSEKKINIGSKAPNNDRYYYVSIDGEKAVFMLLETKVNYFIKPVTQYVSTVLISKPDSETEIEYGKETIERKDLDYKIVFENDNSGRTDMVSTQVMTEPVFSYLNVSNSTTVTHGMWGLTAQTCKEINVDDKIKKKYGIDKPICKVTLKGKDYDYTLYIGNEAKNKTISNDSETVTGYYCYLEGVAGADCIYEISADSLPWLTFKPSDVTLGIITTNYLVDLDELGVTIDGKKHIYKINSSESTDDSKGELQSASMDGKPLDNDLFKSFYEYLVGCPTSEMYFEEPQSKSPEFEITMKTKDGITDKIEFYKDSSRRYIVKINSKPAYRINSSWAETFIKNVENLENKKAIEKSY